MPRPNSTNRLRLLSSRRLRVYGGSSVLLLADYFSDANGTLLTAAAGSRSAGFSWTANTGSGWDAQSNHAVANGGGLYSVNVPQSADGRTSVTTPFGDPLRVVARMLDAGNYWVAQWHTDGGDAVSLHKVEGGGDVEVATVAATLVAGDSLDIEFRGNTIFVRKNNGAALITHTSSFSNTALRRGFEALGAWRWDAFEARN